jgi:hypothetical protein
LLFFSHFVAPEQFCCLLPDFAGKSLPLQKQGQTEIYNRISGCNSEIINKKGINPPFCFARTCGNASAAAKVKQRALARFSRFTKRIGNQRQTTR